MAPLVQRVLLARLPMDAVAHIERIAAAAVVQRHARGMLARLPLPPLDGGGFCAVGAAADGWRDSDHLHGLHYTYGGWAYRCTHTHDTLLPRLHAWARRWRPGVYALELSATLADGTVAMVGSQRYDRLFVTPRAPPQDTVGAAWRMCMQAFTPFHGPPVGVLVRIALV